MFSLVALLSASANGNGRGGYEGHAPSGLTSGKCLLKPEFDAAFGAYCSPCSTADCCSSGAPATFCNWSGEVPDAPKEGQCQSKAGMEPYAAYCKTDSHTECEKFAAYCQWSGGEVPPVEPTIPVPLGTTGAVAPTVPATRVVTTAAVLPTVPAPIVTTAPVLPTVPGPSVVTTAAAPSPGDVPCQDDPLVSVEQCTSQINTDKCAEDSIIYWPVEGLTRVVCAATCHNTGERLCDGGQYPITTTTTTTTTTPMKTFGDLEPSGDDVVDGVQRKLSAADYSKILLSEVAQGVWEPSTLYQAPDLAAAVKKAMVTGVGPMHLFDFADIAGRTTEQRVTYAMVNVAAFLAQAMQETIRYDACDENNWDFESYGDQRYRAASACGQLNQSYQDYKCGNDGTGIDYECKVDPNMEILGTTGASWWGAPPPMFCGPKSKMPVAPIWNHTGVDWPHKCGEAPIPKTFDDIVANLAAGVQCSEYEGQLAGYWEAKPAEITKTNAPNSRSDVEGCCWWGRGVIQSTGVCNFGKLNYHLGARAKREGRDALYGDIDFCVTPGKICSDPTVTDLKWFAGLFYYMSDVQPWSDAVFDYKKALVDFVDGGFSNPKGFIDNVSGIVNRGCPLANCGSGPLHAGPERAAHFSAVLKGFNLIN